jgi:hypothetical protein
VRRRERGNDRHRRAGLAWIAHHLRPGRGQCVAADAPRHAMAASRRLSDCLARYAHCFFVQAGHRALANPGKDRGAAGTLAADGARPHRRDHHHLALTHAFLSIVLGVPRAGVISALIQLKGRSHVPRPRRAGGGGQRPLRHPRAEIGAPVPEPTGGRKKGYHPHKRRVACATALAAHTRSLRRTRSSGVGHSR